MCPTVCTSLNHSSTYMHAWPLKYNPAPIGYINATEYLNGEEKKSLQVDSNVWLTNGAYIV